MTIRSKVQSSKLDKGVWPSDLAAIATARFLELAGNEEEIEMERARDIYAQVLWEFVEDGRITVGDVCFAVGHFAAQGAAESAKADMFSDALEYVTQNGEVDA